ncbi:phosphatase PAP2 family protein [Neobacillus jeddahensis]|uniref:phosphatase PAP2 family protein n=1 Tax=Neobacillus jeddahensis TaxID=1461580 RepID=UPI000694E4C3|nr:phosphatase PAP2 family protein [Neobacillus jeddahensis]
MIGKSKANYLFVFLILAVVIAGFTSIKVAAHSIFWMDDQVAGLLAHTPNVFVPFFILITEMGDKIGIGIVALLMLAWLLIRRRNYLGAAVLALSIALGNEVSNLLKDLFVRPRPELEHLVKVESYSYPSGHAMVGMVVYFMIAYLLMEGNRSKTTKIIIGSFATILLLLIGASRIILHVHYPSDVLGGYALGFIWVTIWLFIYKYLKKRIK